MLNIENNKITGLNTTKFDSKEILELESGIYTGYTIDDEEVIIKREVGSGFNIGIHTKEKPKWWHYYGYDECGWLEEYWNEPYER